MASLLDFLGMGGLQPTGGDGGLLANFNGAGTSYGDVMGALNNNRNMIAGLGLGLMSGTKYNPYGNVAQGFAVGAQQDALNNYRQAVLARQAQNDAYQSQQDKISNSFRERTLANADRPTYEQTGQDDFGRPQYSWVNRSKQTVTPAEGQQSSSAPPPGLDATVDAILAGRMAPPSSFAASKPYWQQVLGLAAQKEPGFDLTAWGTRFNTAKDFAAGPAAKNVTSLNTVMGHIDTLREKADALDNSNLTYANQLKNFIQEKGGAPQVKEFRVARDAVADELAKVFRSVGMSEQQIQMWRGNINEADSPDQLKGAVKTALDLLHSRQEALGEQYKRGMGKEHPGLLDEKGKKALENVNKWIYGAPKGISGGGGSGGWKVERVD